jgi:hypothetical protein
MTLGKMRAQGVRSLSASALPPCIFLDANRTWFWGVSFQLTRRKSYGHVPSLEEAKAAFRAEYEAWRRTNGSGAR